MAACDCDSGDGLAFFGLSFPSTPPSPWTELRDSGDGEVFLSRIIPFMVILLGDADRGGKGKGSMGDESDIWAKTAEGD